MLRYNFKYELKQLLRNRWIQLLSLLLLVLFGFATFNGLQKVSERRNDLSAVEREVKEGDARMVALLDSLDQGLEVSIASWYHPTDPMIIANRYPRLAAMAPEKYTFIATGQSDMFTHYKRPEVYQLDYIEDFTEMTSPVQLLFGSFDLAFVIVYLLPLLIIAFSYNVLSAERESGSLRLLGAQPIKIETWLLQKLGLRFLWLSTLVIAAAVLVLLFLGINPVSGTFSGLMGLTLAYMLFWFVIAFLVNLVVGTSAKNAVTLLGIWITIVLLVPSVLNQLGSSLYPIPSRALMINEMRDLQDGVLKEVDRILDDFLLDHPEYAVNDTTQQRTYWHKYMVAQKMIRTELRPVIDDYEQQLEKQQKWIGKFKWLSPAVVTQEALNRMAGTSSQDYWNFRKQVIDFSKEWRDHFIPFVYNNIEFSKSDIKNLPMFKYEPLKGKPLKAILVILVLSMAVYLLGVLTYVRKSRNGMLTAS